MAHLDAEYRRRWQEYHLKDGTIFNSKEINWRAVEWQNLSKIVTNIEGQVHEMKTDHIDFKCYMCFRWGGQEAIYDENRNFLYHKPINIWTQGWTDGSKCFLEDIDYYTGDKIKTYETSFNEFKGHIHPNIQGI